MRWVNASSHASRGREDGTSGEGRTERGAARRTQTPSSTWEARAPPPPKPPKQPPQRDLLSYRIFPHFCFLHSTLHEEFSPYITTSIPRFCRIGDFLLRTRPAPMSLRPPCTSLTGGHDGLGEQEGAFLSSPIDFLEGCEHNVHAAQGTGPTSQFPRRL